MLRKGLPLLMRPMSLSCDISFKFILFLLKLQQGKIIIKLKRNTKKIAKKGLRFVCLFLEHFGGEFLWVNDINSPSNRIIGLQSIIDTDTTVTHRKEIRVPS
jgi:hypothetical protein